MHLEGKAAQNVDLFAGLGGGGAGAPSAPPLATGLTALHAFHWLRAGEGLCDRDVYLVFS